ncbi:transferrin-binding protein-like solute binding protein [Rodentibacter genomosp. 2]|uniref:transferrin-binding protein-like solute binding protein n=1 Tax=Rodentibacter genomosp. 2 TaxID=1908266 RepID=UPI003B586C95
MTGSSTRTLDNAAGTFNGNLFGKQAEELGGALASKATDSENSWGAVFGAKGERSYKCL